MSKRRLRDSRGAIVHAIVVSERESRLLQEVHRLYRIVAPVTISPRILLPRIQLISGEVRMPFQLSRRQFPVRLAFAMTISKSQGQTFDKIGVYLPRPVFSHGQLYVAFSRVRRMEDVSVMLDRDGVGVTRNVVYRELLRADRNEAEDGVHDEQGDENSNDVVPPVEPSRSPSASAGPGMEELDVALYVMHDGVMNLSSSCSTDIQIQK
jgi:hypothetical protein